MLNLPVQQYFPGMPPPAHLSPFVDNQKEGYVPDRQKEINRLKGEGMEESDEEEEMQEPAKKEKEAAESDSEEEEEEEDSDSESEEEDKDLPDDKYVSSSDEEPVQKGKKRKEVIQKREEKLKKDMEKEQKEMGKMLMTKK